MAARKGPLTKRQKANRAKKARAFIGPPTLKPQHKSHQTRKANAAATKPGVTAGAASAAKAVTAPKAASSASSGTKTITVAKNAPASVSGALRGVGEGASNKATPASPPKAAAASKSPPAKKRFSLSTTPVIAKKASKRFDIKRPGAATTAKVAAKATVAAPAKAAKAATTAKKAGGKGSSPGRSDAAKKAWETRRANGWKPPAKKKA